MKSVVLAIFCCIVVCAGLMAQSAPPDGGLDSRRRHIVEVAAFTAKGDWENLKDALAAALDDGLTVNELREVIIHTYAYCGFPRSIRGLQTFIAVLDERKAKGINDTVGRDITPVESKLSRYERGRDILAEISGVPADAPKAAYAEFAPAIEQFLKEHLFADLFERDILTYPERELATVAVIASIGKAEPMLNSHMRICRNLGITDEQLRQVVGIIAPDSADNVACSKKGELIESDNFKGKAWLSRLMTDTENFDVTVSDVVFEPEARNSWHSHPDGQILIATAGKGYYQEKGKDIQVLRPGDVVAIPANVLHWHGAAPDSCFSHIAINTKVHAGPAKWSEPVTDEEYYGKTQVE